MMKFALPLAIGACAVLTVGAAMAQSETSLAVAQSSSHGKYLADAAGRAVYLLEADGKGTSTCYGACAKMWPPLRAPSANPFAAGPAVQENLIATLERRDGSRQVTYNGHPLYYYVKDQGAGETSGQDVHDEWGGWYLVTPQGTKLEKHSQSAAGASGRQASAGAGSQEIERTFITLDENRDGTVTPQEARGLPALAERFDKVDADASGGISRYEFNTFMSR